MNKIKILFLAANTTAATQSRRGKTAAAQSRRGKKNRDFHTEPLQPTALDPLRLDEEIREITAKIQASRYRDSLELISKWAVRPDDFEQALLVHKPHIVHFSGHGSSKGEIILQDNKGRPQPVSKDALVQLFRTLRDNVRVVVLNACWTRPQVEEIGKTIDCAIGMNQPIGDTAAIAFAASFYRAIGFGRSVQEAFDLAQGALRLAGIPEDTIPELHVRSDVNASELILVLDSARQDENGYLPQEILTELVKIAVTLVDVVRCVGTTVAQKAYDKEQADSACSEYLRRYEHRHANVKILGMAEPVKLASIYTEVRIVPPTSLRGYRTHEELQESFLQRGRGFASHDSDRNKPRSGLDVANDDKYQFLNLLGEPGAGKSTFLRYVGLMALRSVRVDAASQELPDAAASRYRFNLVPVLLLLRDLPNANLDFAGLIDEELQKNGFPSNFGRTALEAGGLLVLLDGLDEVPVDRLDVTIRAIRDLVDQHPRCRYVTSCRTAFYKDYFSRFNDALLTDFTDDQIQNLIENWFRSDRDRGRDTAAKLWNLLRNSEHQATRELARTPLLATFLCLVYDDRQELPNNRAELYREALDILLKKWAASKRVHGEPVFPGLSTRRELSMLEGVAGPAYERGQYFFTARELATAIEQFLRSDAGRPDEIDGHKVVEEIERKQGLFVQRAHDKYSFSHLTLQEYLAACHYHKAGHSQEIIEKTLTEDRWREIHLLLAGLQEPDADAFLLALTTETAKRLTSEPLKSLLSWAERIVKVDPLPRKTAARRATLMGFALALARALALDLDLDLDLARARALARALALDLDLARALDRALDLDLALDLALNLDRGFVLDRARAFAFARARARALDLARNIIPIMMNHEMLRSGQDNRCIAAWADFEQFLQNSGPSFIEELQRLCGAFDIPWLVMQFSRDDTQQCVEYLNCMRRIIECRDAAERVTKAGLDQVCKQLFTPPRSNPAAP